MPLLADLLLKTSNRLLRGFGIAVARLPEPSSLAAALIRLRSLDLEIRTVIDIGASNGHWATQAMAAFPEAKFLLVEANPFHKSSLEQYVRQHGNCQFVLAAAGDKEGEIFFDASDAFGGLASHVPTTEDDIRVPVTTVDTQVRQRLLAGPFMIKLDTHGFEVPILKGAAATLALSNLVVIEVYNFHIASGSLLFYEMCSYMDTLGFRPVDFCDPLHRRKDGALWQMDIFFVRKEHLALASNEF